MTIQKSQGIVSHSNDSQRKTDYLYRISLKGFIKNEQGEVLVVKETGRDWWDLPGGGMDHSENIKSALAREMKEEVNLDCDFTYRIIDVDEPGYLGKHDFWQVRLIFEIKPDNLQFDAGEDGDEITFIDPETFSKSERDVERRISKYNKLICEPMSA